MKRFDQAADKARMLSTLRKDENWALMLGDGTIGNLLDTIAEGRAEDARYMEFLLGEKKWKTALNLSSLQADADLIGYKRTLPQSAIGYVIVSHTDAAGSDRLANLGSYFYDIDATSDYDDIDKSTSSTTEEKKALVPWTSDTPYTVPVGTRFITSDNIEFFSTKSVSSRPLKTPWSTLSASDTGLDTFYSLGGWNGIKYLKIPVMQGIQRSTTVGQTSGALYECFVLPTLKVDAAANATSANYFSVTVTSNGTDYTYTEVDSITRAASTDYAFEKYVLKDESGLRIRFGNGVHGIVPPSGSTVTVNYVETLGKSGNIDSKYQLTTMVLPSGENLVDPRTNVTSSFLSSTNNSTISGGKDIEDIDDFRENAPASYMKSYTIATNAAYLNAILKYSPLSLLHCKIYPDTSISTKQIDSSIGSDVTEEVANEVSTINSSINITALLSNGEVIDDDDVEDEFINPILSSIYDIKGPSDTITYVAPNLIEIRPEVKVKTSDYSYTSTQIQNYVMQAIADEYDIYNQDFNEPLYYSKIVNLAKVFPFSDSVDVTLEAVADVDYEDASIFTVTESSTETTLVAIPFSYDDIFVSDENFLGFKNCTTNSDYVIKCDLLFQNDSTRDSLARTFFLYDNRTDESGTTTLQDGKGLTDDGSSVPTSCISSSTTNGLSVDVNYYNETDETYQTRQVRLAQFPLISDITDTDFMSSAKSWTASPYENRPYIVDSTGIRKLFKASAVTQSLRISLSGESMSESSGNCYKKNSDYIKYADIIFNENYTADSSIMTGFVILPLSYLKFTDLSSLDYSTDSDTYLKTLRSLLKQYVNLRIYAMPKMTDYNPVNVNDIIYLKKDYILVEKKTI